MPLQLSLPSKLMVAYVTLKSTRMFHHVFLQVVFRGCSEVTHGTLDLTAGGPHDHVTASTRLLVSPQLGVGMEAFVTCHTLVLLLVNNHVSVKTVSVLEHLVALIASVGPCPHTSDIGTGGSGDHWPMVGLQCGNALLQGVKGLSLLRVDKVVNLEGEVVDVCPDLEGGFERVGGVQVVTAASVVVGGRDAVVMQSDRVTYLDLK